MSPLRCTASVVWVSLVLLRVVTASAAVSLSAHGGSSAPPTQTAAPTTARLVDTAKGSGADQSESEQAADSQTADPDGGHTDEDTGQDAAEEGEDEQDEEEIGLRPTLSVGHLSSELRLDGDLSEAAWAGAESIGNLTTVEPEEGGAPAGQTIVKVLTSADEIVIGAVAHDPDPSGIVSFSKARDADLDDEDHLTFILDTFLDGRSGYVFTVNPSCARFDGLVVDQGEEVNKNWDAIWEASARRHETGWSVEIRVPIKSIGFARNLPTWGFNVERRIQRLQETSRWSGASQDYEVLQTSRAGLLTSLPDFDLGLGLSIPPAFRTGGGPGPCHRRGRAFTRGTHDELVFTGRPRKQGRTP